LGADDAGRTIIARGTVVGQPTNEGYWILTDQDAVLFVVAEERPGAGEAVRVTGRLAPAAGDQARTWREQARLQPAAGWTVHEDLFIAPVENGQQAAPGAAGTQQQPADTMGAGTAPTTQPGTRSPGTTP